MTGKPSASQRRRLRRADQHGLEPYYVAWPHPHKETIMRTSEDDPARAESVERILRRRGMLRDHPRPTERTTGF